MEALARVGMSCNITVDDLKACLIAQVREMRPCGENGVAPGMIDVTRSTARRVAFVSGYWEA
jgi:hypothetical protein